MPVFTGTELSEIFTPGAVSTSVTGVGAPGVGPDTLYGGAGHDTLDGGGGADKVYGGGGNDYIYAVIGTPETIVGGAGVDTLDTTHFAGDYVINLATGLTNFAGESFTKMENIVAGIGDDILTGSAASNIIYGGGGDDTINGAGGFDASYGGNGNDYIYASISAPETIVGGAGVDTLDVANFAGHYMVNLATGLTNVAFESFTQMENVIAGVGDDTIQGSAGRNILDGGRGDDRLYGGNGADTLIGGLDKDILNGGAGRDVFVFTEPDESLHGDEIRSGGRLPAFEGAGAAAGDLIDLSQIDANPFLARDQAFTFGLDGVGGVTVENGNGQTIVRANAGGPGFTLLIIIRDGDVDASAYSAADFIL